jgi:hypothetical protein
MPILRLEAYRLGSLVINFDSWVLQASVPTIEKFLFWCHAYGYTVHLTYQNGSGKVPKVVVIKV